MKNYFYSLAILLNMGFFCSCSSDEELVSMQVQSDELSSRVVLVNDSIVPFEGDRDTIKRPLLPRTAMDVQEEIDQLEDVPFYLQVQGNSSTKQFLSAKGAGTEVVVENYSGNEEQQFYVKVPSAVMGVPYLIYSKKSNTYLKVGTYTSAPDVKILYADYVNSGSNFGASWDFKRGTYSLNSFVIENQDLPEQGSSGSWMDIYYPVITVNDAKVSFSKYNNSPRQEFAIVPVENFEVESVQYIIDASAVLSRQPDVVIRERYTNNTSLQQSFKFNVNETYKETSTFNRKTSYNVNVTTSFKCKVPFISSGEIKTSVTEGQDFTYGESDEKTFTINREYPVNVPPYEVAELTLTLFKYNMDVEYVATCRGLVSGKRIQIKGRWTGVDVIENDAVLSSTPIDGGKTTSIVITPDMLKLNEPILIK